MKKFVEEFKKFALRGNVIDMAVGVIIGSAFGKIVSSLVNDLFMPVLNLLIGGANTSGMFVLLGHGSFATQEEAQAALTTIEAAKEAGVATLNYGMFIQTVIDFLMMALCVFLFVKGISKLHKKETPPPAKNPRLCPFCISEIPDTATRCPHCTSELDK